MISKNDALAILVKLEKNGLNVNQQISKLLNAKDIPQDILQFITLNNGLEASNFYEMLRQKHNKNKSPLYKNILKEDVDISTAITTLTCLLTQIVLYSNKLESKEAFLKEARAEEISRVLNNYFKTFDATGCLAELQLVRADLSVIEYLRGRRNIVQ